jgi:hypothetical protein
MGLAAVEAQGPMQAAMQESTAGLPARSCSPSTFWVMSVRRGTRRASSAIARCPALGWQRSTNPLRHSYQPQTSAGSAMKASGVANCSASKLAHRPVRASRKVGMPLSCDTPAPVKTTRWRLARSRAIRVAGMAVVSVRSVMVEGAVFGLGSGLGRHWLVEPRAVGSLRNTAGEILNELDDALGGDMMQTVPDPRQG